MLRLIVCKRESSKNASAAAVSAGAAVSLAARPAHTKRATPRTTGKARFAISVLLAARLQHELKPEDAAPECGPVWHRITVRVLNVFPQQVGLQLDEAVERPVDAQRQDTVA